MGGFEWPVGPAAFAWFMGGSSLLGIFPGRSLDQFEHLVHELGKLGQLGRGDLAVAIRHMQNRLRRDETVVVRLWVGVPYALPLHIKRRTGPLVEFHLKALDANVLKVACYGLKSFEFPWAATLGTEPLLVQAIAHCKHEAARHTLGDQLPGFAHAR